MLENLEQFLKETNYCDYSHSDIQKLANEFKNKYNNQRDLAVALFHFARDNILYRVGLWNKKASETLSEKEGACTNSANLLVALLRACDIPAGYGVMRVNAQEYFGPVMLETFRNKVSKNSIHTYCYVYLDNKWIKCDPSDDKELSDSTSYFNPTTKLVQWDGFCDSMLNLDPKHILKDDGPIENIDHIIAKKPRNARGIPIKVANLYIKFLRQNNKKINDTKELEPLFMKWLRKENPLYFYLYFVVSAWRNLKAMVAKS